jgi:hypothetical protein
MKLGFKILTKAIKLFSKDGGRKDSTKYVNVVFHVGLPKTATSFLQMTLFARCPSINLIHRKVAQRERLYFNNVLRGKREATKQGVLRRLRSDVLNIVSDENISITPLSIWKGKDDSPTATWRRLSELSRLVTGRDNSFRTIMTIRRQDRWLASRYAESAKLFEIADQSDFEERVSGMLARADGHQDSWLNYHHTVSAFSERIGRDKILVLMQEELEANPFSWTRQLEDFLGINDLSPILSESDVRPRNVLSTGVDSWKLRGHKSEIRLPEWLSKRILDAFASSNRKLASEFSIDGARFGYY